MPTINVQINRGIADGYMEGGIPYSDVMMVDMGKLIFVAPGTRKDAWFHFSGINIPKSVLIQDARLRFSPSETRGDRTVNLKIIGEASDNPTPANMGDYFNRSRTSINIPWDDVPQWTSGTAIDSPNIAAIIQEIVNRPGWVAGNNLQIFVEDNGSTGAEYALRRCWAYDATPGSAVVLSITYEVVVTFTLTISATEGGTTTPSPGNYAYGQGSIVSIQATPNAGYKFDHWELDGVNVGSTNPISVTMNVNHVLDAVFSKLVVTHAVQVKSSPISGVPVTVDGASVGSTPTPSIIVEEGNHTVSVPQEVVA